MLYLKMKLLAALLGTSVSVGRHNMVSRKSENVYSVPGEGEFYTKGCGFTAPRMTVDVSKSRGKLWATFMDSEGEVEGECEIIPYLLVRRIPASKPINRNIATTK